VTPASLATATLVSLGQISNRTFVLPLVIFYATSRCNSRCISCDWWKHTGSDDLSLDEIGGIADATARLGTRTVVFSGGEPLLRPDVFEAAQLFRRRTITLHLLSSGLLLERLAEGVARHFSRVCISLDAADESRYERIRGVPALHAVERGIAKLRRIAPQVNVTARATLQRENFRLLPDLIDHARRLGLDGISFLPADVRSSDAFGRDAAIDSTRLALDRDEIATFEATIERTIRTHAGAFESGFVAESPQKLRRLPAYYRAVAGDGPFPAVECNAPWVSIVIEANGAVRPCFFHRAIGNVRDRSLESIVDNDLRTFRAALRVGRNPVCERCVCTLKTGWRRAPWM